MPQVGDDTLQRMHDAPAGPQGVDVLGAPAIVRMTVGEVHSFMRGAYDFIAGNYTSDRTYFLQVVRENA